MKFLTPIFLLAFLYNVSAQYCNEDLNYTESRLSNKTVNLNLNVKYGEALDWKGESVNLYLDIYTPDDFQDSLTIKPLIMIIHGGGFRFGDKLQWANECLEFAERGFIAVTMKYRLGWDSANADGQLRAMYRAQQDANAALRYLVNNSSELLIDTNYIFIGGGSAGAITALNVNYVDQNEWNLFIPNVEEKLGGLNTSGNDLIDNFTIKAIYNNWGATHRVAITEDEMVPMISFHGELDHTVLIDSTDNGFYGSRALHNLLQEHGICSDLTVKPDAGHTIYKDIQGTDFRVGRASCFFRSIFCDDCSSFYSTDSIPATCSEDIVSVSEQNNPIHQDYGIFPNPASDYVTIRTKDNSDVSIFDCYGKKVIFIESTDNLEQRININNLSQGIYFVKIGNKIEKLLIER